MDKMSMRIGDLEVRTCNKFLLQNKDHTTAQIIHWMNDDTCCTMASWKMYSEGHELHFVGDRPFNIGNKDDFWTLAKVGQEYLDNNFYENDN